MNLNPYLFFDGQCKEAFESYAKCLKGDVLMSMKYGDAPGCEEISAEERDRIIHLTMSVGDKLLMGSDCPPGRYEKPQGVSIAIDFDTPEEAERVFAELSEQGRVHMPMGKTFWAERFGMATDRFGISWMVGCNRAPGAA